MTEVERLRVELAMSEAIAASRGRMVDFMTEYADLWHMIADSRLNGADTEGAVVAEIETFRAKWCDGRNDT